MALNCTALLNENDMFYWNFLSNNSDPNVHEDVNKTAWYVYVTCKRCGGACCKNSRVHTTEERLGFCVAAGIFQLAYHYHHHVTR